MAERLFLERVNGLIKDCRKTGIVEMLLYHIKRRQLGFFRILPETSWGEMGLDISSWAAAPCHLVLTKQNRMDGWMKGNTPWIFGPYVISYFFPIKPVNTVWLIHTEPTSQLVPECIPAKSLSLSQVYNKCTVYTLSISTITYQEPPQARNLNLNKCFRITYESS